MRRATPFELAEEDDAAIGVTVRWSDAHESQGVLQRGTRSTLHAVFGEQPPSVALGSPVALTLFGLQNDGEVRIGASALARTDRDGRRTYAFRMEERRAARDRVSRFIEATSNRRSSYRAQPPPRLEMAVKLDHLFEGRVRRRTSAILLDISTQGCGVQVGTDVDRLFSDATTVNVGIPFPGDDELIEMVAEIRHRRLARGKVRYGLTFNVEATPRFRAHQERIAKQVMRWQREQITAVHRSIEFL